MNRELHGQDGILVQLLRGTEAAGAELKAQIPWLRVFVEGVVIVGAINRA